MTETLTKAITTAIHEGKIKAVDFKVFTRITLALESSTSRDFLDELDKRCDVFYAGHKNLTVFGVFTETGTILSLGPGGHEKSPTGFCSIPYEIYCSSIGIKPTSRHTPKYFLHRLRDHKFLYDVMDYRPSPRGTKKLIMDLTEDVPAKLQEEQKDGRAAEGVHVNPQEKNARPQERKKVVPAQPRLAPEDTRTEKKRKRDPSAESTTTKSRIGSPMTSLSFLCQKQPIIHPMTALSFLCQKQSIIHPSFPQGGYIYWVPVAFANEPRAKTDQTRRKKNP